MTMTQFDFTLKNFSEGENIKNEVEFMYHHSRFLSLVRPDQDIKIDSIVYLTIG